MALGGRGHHPLVELDLDRLGVMHPKLQLAGEAELYQRRGALALTRSQHAPGVSADVVNGAETFGATLRWTAIPSPKQALDVVDEIRLTEDGAEAVALAFVHARSGWQAKRRVQREGFADWLLQGASNRKLALALEVSGTASDDAEKRLRKKLAQVSRHAEKNNVRAALVVSFAEPRILAATVEGGAIP